MGEPDRVRSTGELRVRLHGDNGRRVVWLEGELDMANVPSVTEALDLVTSEAPGVLVVDLQNLSFMDSSGLHWLLNAERTCRAVGTRLLLIRGPRPVQRVLEISGVASSFTFVSDASEAVPEGVASGSVSDRLRGDAPSPNRSRQPLGPPERYKS